MKKIKNKKILVFFAVIFSFVITSSVSYAGTTENVRGWTWGGTEQASDATVNGNETMLYWVSMNSANCDANDDGKSDGAPAGCPAAGTTIGSYGINIPASGAVTGVPGVASGHPYVWSDKLGWIDFAPSGPYPTVATGDDYAHGVQRKNDVSGDRLTGWARIMSIQTAESVGNSGGWSGWIRLSSDANDPIKYGPKINTEGTITKGSGTSYSWSNELGWIDFSRVNIIVPPVQQCGSENGKNYNLDLKNDWDTQNFCDPIGGNPSPAPTFSTTPGAVTWSCPGVVGVCSASFFESCTPDPSCANSICEGDTCRSCTTDYPGTKRCPDLNWQEVKP